MTQLFNYINKIDLSINKNKSCTHNQNENLHKLFIQALLLILIIIASFIFIAQFIPNETYDINVLLPQFRNYVYPKPLEQAIFQCCCLIVPVFIFIRIIFNNTQTANKKTLKNKSCKPKHSRKQITIANPTSKSNYWWSNAALIICSILFYGFFSSEWLNTLCKSIIILPPNLLLFSTLILGSCYALLLLNIDLSKFNKVMARFNTAFYLILVIFITISWRIYGIASINHTHNFYVHFDAVLYPLTQVVQGKTLLVDLPSQYGLFPEIIAPFFKIFGLSVLKFTSFMAVLLIIALFMIYFVTTRVIKNQWLIFLVGCSLIALTCENVSMPSEAYLQYWPVRFFWPAVSLYLFYMTRKYDNFWTSAIFSAFSAIAALWNLDTGLFIVIGYFVYLLTLLTIIRTNARLNNKFKAQLIKLLLHFIIVLTFVSCFFIYLTIKADNQLSYYYLFEYQKIFYKLGFYMIPLNVQLDPWMAVISIYIYGFIYSVNGMSKSIYLIKSSVVFYLSVLGLGLFIYFEGRSHPLNLFKVMWPAIIICGVFAESILRQIKLGLLAKKYILIQSIILAIPILCLIFLLSIIPKYYQNLKLLMQPVDDNNLTLNELEFIKANTPPNSQCLLLMKNQASYSAEAKLSSPITGPGLVETLLISDAENMARMIIDDQPECIIIGYGSSASSIGLDYNALLKNYVSVANNSLQTLVLYRPEVGK